MNFRVKGFAEDARGAVLAESAVALLLLLLLLSVTFELSRFIYTYNTLAKSTRASARYLSTHFLNTTSVAEAKNLAVYGNVRGSGSKVLPDLDVSDITVDPQGGFPDLVTVRVTGYTYAPLLAIGPVRDVVSIQLQPSTTVKYLQTTEAY